MGDRPRAGKPSRYVTSHPVFENTYFSFFFQISKKRDFLRFFEMTPKKRKKSVAKILSSMMLTLLEKRKKFVECL